MGSVSEPGDVLKNLHHPGGKDKFFPLQEVTSLDRHAVIQLERWPVRQGPLHAR